MKTTKRRKVWANWYGGQKRKPWGTCLGSRNEVLDVAQEGAEQVRLVEAHPGDVVLSREDVAELLDLAVKGRYVDIATVTRTRALLRGGR